MGGELTTAVLWGPEHVEFDKIETRALGADLAIGLSRGRLPKQYSYTDPNEDVVAAVSHAGRQLLVVADGHNGHEAATLAVKQLLFWAAAGLPPRVSPGELVDLIYRVSGNVHTAMSEPDAPHGESRTALVVALLVERELSFAAMGDSALYVVDASGTKRLDTPRGRFVGYPMVRDDVALALSLGSRTVAAGEHVVLATDGFTDFATPDDEALIAAYSAGSATEQVVHCITTAFEGGAGDNVGIAIARR